MNFSPNHIYNFNPLPQGSTSVKVFEEQVKLLLNSSRPVSEIMNNLSGNRVMIINDLELWWERSESGFEIIDKIMELISRFGNKWFFIVNLNVFSFSFIKKIKSFEHYFLKIVRCEPFDAEELKDIILKRHHASGMKFILNKAPEDQISELKLARLFNKYFDFSNGNIGAALNGWIKSIQSVEDNIIYTKYPQIVMIPFISKSLMTG